jgi:hypothetical protein
LNLGAEAFDAVNNLKNNRDWLTFRGALVEQMNRWMHGAIEAASDRDMACGYARALRDVVAAIETFEQGPPRGGGMRRPAVKSSAGNV